ncbi:MAG: apolipoprotein D and lipocalin family protein [Sediminicola sp.]|jgi:apolipoprotein D and lipocalin family protein|tara:strand:+ start:2879 stop:3412 length:534 start_codon:yes stop_codon:yes gene_type:complete
MVTRKLALLILTLIIILGFYSCSTIPKGAVAIETFDKENYLGKWYEIARLDFKYERNLNNTTAEYSINKNSTIKVDNKGYNTKEETWTQSTGIAKFVGDENIGMLKVSFFRPFYGGYNVIAIDPEYKYALIAGSSLKYLWLLSRDTTLPDEIKKKYLKIAEGIGYTTTDLIWVEHNK